jgi:hypothetical protein
MYHQLNEITFYLIDIMSCKKKKNYLSSLHHCSVEIFQLIEQDQREVENEI